MQDLELDTFFFEDSYLKKEVSELDLSGLTDGKHLRSRLLYLTGQLFEQDDKTLTKLGRIVELVHNATLTHDDVIDNSDTRRNRPSVPALINNKKSVLLGDYMLARALHELSDFNNPKLTQELTLTLKELVEGEWIQYENTNPYEITPEIYRTLALKKTGSLFRWAFIAPLVAAKEMALYQELQEFGEELGVIFQMADDMIDFNTQSKKTYGLDFRNNNINYVLHFVGLNHPEQKKHFLQTETIEDLSRSDQDIILDSIEKAKLSLAAKLAHCNQILDSIQKKLPKEAHFTNVISEFKDLLVLVTDRLF